VARKPAAASYLQPTLLEIDIVVHNDKSLDRRLEEPRRSAN
jgi:hypothetical protein